MTAEQLFSILNMAAIAAWLPLVFIPRLLVVPILLLTFLVGPGGLLLYIAIRSFVRERAGSVEDAAA